MCELKLKNHSRMGSILLITALSAVFFLGMTAMVTDVGYMYYSQSKLQTATNAGWKAGYDRMIMITKGGSPILSESQKNDIRAHVLEVVTANGYTPEEAELEINFEAGKHLTVKSNKTVGLFFAKALGINSTNISSQRENQPNDLGGICPLAIPDYEIQDVSPGKYRYKEHATGEFEVGRPYILKLGESPFVAGGDLVPWGAVDLTAGADSENFGYVPGTEYVIKVNADGAPLVHGNFGCLDLDGDHGGGANDYRDVVKYGYEGTVNVGDLIYPETGNMAGPTVDAVEYRMEHGLEKIRVPIVDGYGNGQSERCEILGFLNFTLTRAEEYGKGNNAQAIVTAVYTGATDNTEGRDKISFGRIDPDNNATNPTNYVNNFKYGFGGPINMGEMLLPENGNAPDLTNESVDYRLNPTNSNGATRTVIIPITEVPSEIGVNNPDNVDAKTIYDLVSTDSPGESYKLKTDTDPAVDGYTFGSSVRVIGFAKFELIDPYDFQESEDYEAGDLGPNRPGQVRGKFLGYVVKPGEM